MVSIDNLSDAILEQLETYQEEVTEVMKKSVDKASNDCMKTIKNHISFKQSTGKYVKNFRLKTSFQDDYTKRKTWYVGGGEYRLTHLLEYGHAKVNGGRTRAFPHIKYGEEVAQTNLINYLKEGIQK